MFQNASSSAVLRRETTCAFKTGRVATQEHAHLTAFWCICDHWTLYAPWSFVRPANCSTSLKLSYEAEKKRADPYTRTIEALPEMRRETVELVRKAVAESRRASVLVNNRNEGNASLAIQAPADQLHEEAPL